MSAGREWFIHTIYTVRSRDNAYRGIGKRSVEYHALGRHQDPIPESQRRAKRSNDDAPDVAEEIGVGNNRGTNILHITLDRGSQQRTSPEREAFTKGVIPRELNQGDGGGGDDDDGLVLIVGIVVGLLLTVLLVIVVALLLRSKRDGKDAPKNSSSAEPMVTRGLGSSDSSEV